jgi:hypothetical protein
MATSRSASSSAATLPPEPPLMAKPTNSKLDAAPPEVNLLVPSNMDDLSLDPDAVLGTRHSGPLLSGAPEDGAAGIAMLHKRAKIYFTNGSFSIPVQFPASSVLTTLVVQIQQSYNGLTPKLNLGTALNGTDVASVDLSVAPTQVFNNIATILPSNWKLYLSQVLGTGNSAGKCTVLISYSVPAKTLPS